MSDSGIVATVIAIAAVVAIVLWYALIRRGRRAEPTTPGETVTRPMQASAPTVRPPLAPAAPARPEPAPVAAAPLAEMPAAQAPVVEPPPVAPLVMTPTVATSGMLEITEINQAATSDGTGEWVAITNNGAEPVQLAGWRLTDEGSIHDYTFPERVLEPGASIRVHMWAGDDDADDLFVGRRMRWWNNEGDTAYLYDAEGQLVHKHGYGTAAAV